MSPEQPNRVNVEDLDESQDLIWIKKFQEENLQRKGFGSQLLDNFQQNPFVPLGLTATIGALSYGIWSFMKGDKLMSQYMMRARVGAQAFTIVAIVGGLLYQKPKNK